MEMSDRDFWERIVPRRMKYHREWQEREADKRGREILLELNAMCLHRYDVNARDGYKDLPDATRNILGGLGK